MSHDGVWSIVVIALVGNPFSARYARARAREPMPDALDHCALNVAIYGPRPAWSLHERAIKERDRHADTLMLGTSRIGWNGHALEIDIDERTTPFAGVGRERPVRGRVVLEPELVLDEAHDLDADRRHRWWPIAPLARIAVTLTEPSISFVGHGYHDANAGSVPLETSFRSWSWARARGRERAHVVYDLVERGGRADQVAFTVSGRGSERLSTLSRVSLPPSRWGLPRGAWTDRGSFAQLARSLEDGPFYARDLVRCRLGGDDVVAMHETLSADRWARRWARFLSGFRTA